MSGIGTGTSLCRIEQAIALDVVRRACLSVEFEQDQKEPQFHTPNTNLSQSDVARIPTNDKKLRKDTCLPLQRKKRLSLQSLQRLLVFISVRESALFADPVSRTPPDARNFEFKI